MKKNINDTDLHNLLNTWYDRVDNRTEILTAIPDHDEAHGERNALLTAIAELEHLINNSPNVSPDRGWEAEAERMRAEQIEAYHAW